MGYQFELSVAALDIVAEQLGFPATRQPFEIASVGQTLDERAAVRDAVWRHLSSIHLARRGRLEPEVEQALALYGQAPAEIAMGVSEQRTLRVLARAGVAERSAVLAVGVGETIRFELTQPASIAPGLIRLLPAAPPGPGSAVTVPLPGANQDEDINGPDHLVSGRPNAAQSAMRAVRELFAQPRVRFGYVDITGRGRAFRDTFSWFDTEQGRYLALTSPDGRGGKQVTYAPVDGHRLIRELAGRIGVGPTR